MRLTPTKLIPAMTAAPLAGQGVDAVIGTVVNPAGLIHAKTVPVRRTTVFADPGLGASPSWHAFASDQTGIAFTKDCGVTGDQRIRIDLSALRILGDGLAWAPAAFFDQDGTPVAACSRGTLSRIEAALAAAGVEAMVGHEIEFVLVNPDGSRLPSNQWAQYGLSGVLEHEAFVREVTAAAAVSGLLIEQFHPEYGANQFELSLAPQSPVAAADQLVLARVIIGRTARRYGIRASLSPVPFAHEVNSGAHQHVSLANSAGPLFSGGKGARGMTEAGEHALAGILDGLAEAQGVLCGSIVSGLRMQPGKWAGPHICWGTENREAALRFINAGPANPYGANFEVKVVDPSANPYFASAAILALALAGIQQQAALPPEVSIDPAALSDNDRDRAGIALLSPVQAEVIAKLDQSQRMRTLLGDPAVDMLVAVRRWEHEKYAHLDPEQLTEKFRMAWSV